MSSSNPHEAPFLADTKLQTSRALRSVVAGHSFLLGQVAYYRLPERFGIRTRAISTSSSTQDPEKPSSPSYEAAQAAHASSQFSINASGKDNTTKTQTRFSNVYVNPFYSFRANLTEIGWGGFVTRTSQTHFAINFEQAFLH